MLLVRSPGTPAKTAAETPGTRAPEPPSEEYFSGDETADNKNKCFSYHNLSDIDLGYTKRQSAEYYDDVKRTLNFDDEDTENPTEDELAEKTRNFLFKNSTSTPTKGDNKIAKAPGRSAGQTNKIRVLKKVKSSGGKQNVSGRLSLNSSRSTSMTASCGNLSSVSVVVVSGGKNVTGSKRVWK
jgi:hypothetical protein